MPQSVPTIYRGALKKPQKAPVYIVTFENVPERFSNLTVKKPIAEVLKLMTTPGGVSLQITVDEGRASVGQFSFGLLDKRGLITKIISQRQIANFNVTVTTGFAEIDEDQYVIAFTGTVLDFKLMNDNLTWMFQVRNNLDLERKRIFKATAMTTVDYPATGTPDLIVDNASDFAAASGVAPDEFFLRIDDEVLSYTSRTLTTFTGITRALRGTIAAEHSLDTEVTNHCHLAGNGVDIALKILTSTGLGTNGPFDVYPASAGLAIPEAQIDVNQFIREKQRWLGASNFEFDESGAVDGKKFLESELYRFMNAYPIINNDGQLSFKVATVPLPTERTVQINDGNIIGAPTFQGNVLARYFFNEVDISFDFDFLSGKFLTRALFEEIDSQGKFRTTKTLVMKSRGVRTGLSGTINVPSRIANRIFLRFANPSPIIRVRGQLADRLVEPGDIVLFSSSKIPDIDRGTRGVDNQLLEVTHVRQNYRQGELDFLLLNTGISAGRKYAAITPSSMPPINFPVFTAADAQQKNFAFISLKINDTKGVMSDSTDGYYITP